MFLRGVDAFLFNFIGKIKIVDKILYKFNVLGVFLLSISRYCHCHLFLIELISYT